MQQIADWLQKLGMSEYTQRFAENGISFAALRHLTDQDLRDIGVLLGHRRIMLAAIQELGSPAVAQPVTTELKPQHTAERRQVTVMFSDLVGSTAMSARMDPEDLREVLSAYQKCVVDTVRRFGGYVANYMGDGVLVYFGYPKAHEDDAERAVQAGLELIAAVTALKTSVSLQTRVGIATGLVVVGDLIGSGETLESGIVGETPNLAARLQGIAEPNTVVIAQGTRKLVGNLFELEDLGTKDLKGIAGPVRAWAALRPSVVESRFEAFHATGATELVGREEEREILLRRWSRAKNGEGQVVLLSGEAGIGKSRLTAALLEDLAAEPHARLRYFCSPQHTDSAYFPIISQMERAAGFTHADTESVKLDKLDAVLALASTSKHDAAQFAEMLSLPNDGRYPALELAPQQRRQRTFEALVSQVVALSRQNPLLLIFEDAHWSDPTSLELFSCIVDKVPTLRVLLIVAFRPEFDPPWIGRPYVTALTLNRLAEREISAMIDRVVGNKLLPANIRQDIIERTDGIPLFVEEMTKAVLEAGSDSAAEPYSRLTVPASLQASLMARLDRLGAGKEVAQIGAAIGREFSYALLATVVGKPEAEVNSLLDRLVAAGLLFRQGVAPHETYLFKHALVQDAAYGTLLREPKRAFHARIAETLESQFVEIAESQPELLARHYTEAGLTENAALLWGKAGQRSLVRSALVEAIEQLTRALDQIATLPATPAMRQQEIKLQVALITPLIHVKTAIASETRGAIERARLLIEKAEALGEPPEDPLLLFSVLYGSGLANVLQFNSEVLRCVSEQFLALATKHGSTVLLMIGHRLVGTCSLFMGDIADGRKHLDRAFALYDPCEHGSLATPFGDAGVSILCSRSSALSLLGNLDAALADANQALKNARAIGHAATLNLALDYASFVHLRRGDYAMANALIDELIALADEKRASAWKWPGTMKRGVLFVVTGKFSDAVKLLTAEIGMWRIVGVTFLVPAYLSFLATAYMGLDQFNDAWRCIQEAMTTIDETKEKWWEAEIHRVAGEIVQRSPEPDAAKAEAYFERALSVARQQQAKSWELRAAMSLARLWRSQGKPQQARELLAPVYGWFTEGFDTRDLKEAKALLEELAS